MQHKFRDPLKNLKNEKKTSNNSFSFLAGLIGRISDFFLFLARCTATKRFLCSDLKFFFHNWVLILPGIFFEKNEKERNEFDQDSFNFKFNSIRQRVLTLNPHYGIRRTTNYMN